LFDSIFHFIWLQGKQTGIIFMIIAGVPEIQTTGISIICMRYYAVLNPAWIVDYILLNLKYKVIKPDSCPV